MKIINFVFILLTALCTLSFIVLLLNQYNIIHYGFEGVNKSIMARVAAWWFTIMSSLALLMLLTIFKENQKA